MDESKPVVPTEAQPESLPVIGPDSRADWLVAARLRLRLKNNELESAQAKFNASRVEIERRDAEIKALQTRLAEWESVRQTWIGRCLALDARIEVQRARIRSLWTLLRQRGIVHVGLRIARKLAGSAAVEPVSPACVTWAGTDIIVCVHNALDDVKRCLAALIRQTRPLYRLILVDDGSDAPVRDYLADFARSQGAQLLRNEAALGYTRAANQGLAASLGRAVVLLNSDTVVTAGWLESMQKALNAHQDNGIVGPMSNTASWQSLPEIEQQGDWADNALPDDVSIDCFARWFRYRAVRVYPSLPFLNGFCLLIDRRVIEQIGYFDEAAFGRGYGEENDYCLRARAAGFRLALADDCYIYHAQSKSYSHEQRRVLAKEATQTLIDKYGAQIIAAGVEDCRYAPILLGIRAMARQLIARQRLVESGRQRFEGKRVLFVLPVFGAGGGSNVILAEARAMLEMGVDVRILNLSCHRDLFEAVHPNMNLPLVYTEGRDETLLLASEYDAVVATVHFTLEWILPLRQLAKPPQLAYYCQDYEPDFYPPGSLPARRAAASYEQSGCRYFTKTQWNRQALARHGADAAVVGASYDCDLFRPRPRCTPAPSQGPVRICAMVRPSTPRRNPQMTMQLLRALKLERGAAVEILIFGVEADDPDFTGYPSDFDFTLLGLMNPLQMAALLNDIDIFVDFSLFQAMGLTAMEAMASGVAVIVPQAGGTAAFARDGENALIVDTADQVACSRALDRLIDDIELRTRITRQAIADLPQFHPQQAAWRILDYLFPERYD